MVSNRTGSPVFNAENIDIKGSKESSSIFSSASIENLEFFQDRSSSWRTKEIKANGKIGEWLSSVGISFNPKGMSFEYNYDDQQQSSIYKITGGLQTFEDDSKKPTPKESLFKNGWLCDFRFGYPEGGSGWQILGWEANGTLALDTLGIELKTPIKFEKNGDSGK